MKNGKSTHTTITIHPETPEQAKALKAFAKALKMKFEVAREESEEGAKEEPYDPEFVAKIERGHKDHKEGKGRKVTMDELNEL